MGNSVPGGWFIGRPASREEEPQAAATEHQPAMTKQTPRDCFAGTSEYLGPQEAAAAAAATEPAGWAGELRRLIKSFVQLYSWFTLAAHLFVNLLNSPKVICCKSTSSGSRKQESRVLLPTSCIGVNAYNMENKHNRRSDNPSKLPFERIKLVTNNFSEELGRGSFGQVFKGVLEDGEEVAVKMLYFMSNINDQHFENEFEILKLLKHPNIVRLVGFCDEAKEELVEYHGELIVCQRIHRALCLEYMPNGSLGKLLTGKNIGKEWTVRHKIILGICKGLEYLQEGLESPIFHLDLKPDNILLNKEMMPKISDFGLSRLIGEENSKKTLTPLGTLGYLPPEFINYQVISKEYDIYSLGVIITKTITGITGYSDVADMGAEEFIEHVHENWKKCLQEIPRYESVEVDCKKVRRCIEIARRCMENDRHKRPTIKDIVSQLDEIEMENSKLDSPLELAEGPMMVPVPSEDGDSWLPDFFRPEEIPRRPRRLRLRLLLEEDVSPQKDPPSDNAHPARPEHRPKVLMTDAGAPFLCNGCKQLGYGPRCRGDHALDFHTRCARAEDPLSDLHTLLLPLFGYGKQFQFRFRHQPPLNGRGVCDACGAATWGFVYHCSEQGLNLHPCCASLPDRILCDGRDFDLHRRASRPCALCPDNETQRRWFWAYRCYLDGDPVDLHVACLKETARRSWKANNVNRLYMGDGALNVDGRLQNMFSNKFGETTAGTVASFITALVFGRLTVKV